MRTFGATEIFSRLGNDPDVADVLVDAQVWPEAFKLAERNPKLKSRIYGPHYYYSHKADIYFAYEEVFRYTDIQARILGGNKLAMQLLKRLRRIRIPENLQSQVEK